MGHSRARMPIGPMVDCLQPSSSNPRIHDQVPSNPNSSAPSSPTNINENTTGGSPTQPPMKKKRGPSWPIKDWGTGKKLDIKLNNYNQPIGENASKLATQLGVIARNGTYCPIIYNDWRCRQLRTYKERIWKEVKDNCNVSDLYKRICLQSVGRKWRNWKDELKLRHYDIFDNDEERLAITPERVQDDQWKVFVQYQGTDRAKELSKINRENQKKKVMSHSTGRKSHAVVRDEMTVDGKEPDRVKVFFKTHKGKGEKPVDQTAADAMEAMEKKFKEVPESQHTPEFLEKVFTDVLGCDTHGRVRTHGLGPSPTQVFGKKCNHEEQHVHDLERAREEGRQERDKELLVEINSLKLYCERLEDQIRNISSTIPKPPVMKSIEAEQVSDADSSHHQAKHPTNSPFEVGMIVQLLNIDMPKKVVAYGIIISKDPQYKLDGMKIGEGFWAVRITKVIIGRDILLINRRSTRTVGQAFQKNESVFWRAIDMKKMDTSLQT